MEAALLQCLHRRGCLKETQAVEFLRKAMETDVTLDALEELRLHINRELEFADIEIRRMVFPLDGTRYVGLVNKQSDDFVAELLAKKHASSRPEFFKRLMVRILRSDEEVDSGGCLSEAEAMRIGRGSCPGFETELSLSVDECTAALEALLKEGWLTDNPNKPGYYSLGVRAFMEFHDDILHMDLPEATRTALEPYL